MNGKIQRISRNKVERCSNGYSAHSEIHSTFPDKPFNLAKIYRWFKKLEDQAILGKGEFDLKSWFKILTAHQETSLSSLTVLRRLTELGYKNKWLTFALSLVPPFVRRLN